VNQTWIDGRKYFDRADEAAAEKNFAAQREALIQKAIGERVKDIGKRDTDEKKGANDKDTTPGKDVEKPTAKYSCHEGSE
jgi:3-methyladenine DNA glycosylase AlkD